MPNFSANFSKKFLDGNTSFLAEIKHDYTEKEWSNVSEENMTALVNLRYKWNDQLRIGVEKTNPTRPFRGLYFFRINLLKKFDLGRKIQSSHLKVQGEYPG